MDGHAYPHPRAGEVLTLREGVDLFDLPADQELDSSEKDFLLEDWWDRVSGGIPWWNLTQRNPACANYAVRASSAGIPLDNQVVYGKIDSLGYLVHVTELIGGEVPEGETAVPPEDPDDPEAEV